MRRSVRPLAAVAAIAALGLAACTGGTSSSSSADAEQTYGPGALPTVTEGKLTVAKWAKLAKCSRTEAEADIADLVSRGILREDRSTRHISYSLETEAL